MPLAHHRHHQHRQDEYDDDEYEDKHKHDSSSSGRMTTASCCSPRLLLQLATQAPGSQGSRNGVGAGCGPGG